ncbi:MAG: zinc ribbon domain-containing protein [Chloroflexota bacterium]|nr:zinc ribbon domain-containing protein [Chloroflexota bacterium]
MEPETSARYCAACGERATLDASYCVACGRPLQPHAISRSLTPAPMRVVEADAPAPPATVAPVETSPLAALPRLAALAWRQPAVRSAVKTGASAVALSLVWRLAGAALTRGRAQRLLLPPADSESLAPMVGDLLREATPGKRLRRRGRRGEIVEETVYIRRIFRR